MLSKNQCCHKHWEQTTMYKALDVRAWESRREKRKSAFFLPLTGRKNGWNNTFSQFPCTDWLLFCILRSSSKEVTWQHLWAWLLCSVRQVFLHLHFHPWMGKKKKSQNQDGVKPGTRSSYFHKTYWPDCTIIFHLGRKSLPPQHCPLFCDPRH